ncbi:hypothetical protein C2E23DRAFT_858583 [Lenzites betulinus]|nr:hypothetical protein C2E23DRAFT_858583 [Lenzites betulinus]
MAGAFPLHFPPSLVLISSMSFTIDTPSTTDWSAADYRQPKTFKGPRGRAAVVCRVASPVVSVSRRSSDPGAHTRSKPSAAIHQASSFKHVVAAVSNSLNCVWPMATRGIPPLELAPGVRQ